MISIDDTMTGTASAPRRNRSGTSKCGFCKQRVPRGHSCAQKEEAMKPRPCGLAECGALFKPSTYAQAYCCAAHKSRSRNQREYESKRRHYRKQGPLSVAKAEIATIAPLERVWERAARKAAQYVPVMGEALYETTMRLMRAA